VAAVPIASQNKKKVGMYIMTPEPISAKTEELTETSFFCAFLVVSRKMGG
jgi:hypothetical protein